MSVARAWVLDTSTKGTGANMVPLDEVVRRPSGHDEPIHVPPPRPPRPPSPPEPRRPRSFKVVEITTRRVLAEGVTAREAIDVLSGVRSIVDVSVSVWQPDKERWRQLTFAERSLLWDHRDDSRDRLEP